MLKNNKNIVTIDLHMNSMNIISKTSGDYEIKHIYLPNSVMNHEDVTDIVHLKYLIKKNLLNGKNDICLVYSNSDLIVRNIDVSNINGNDLNGYLKYQIQDLIPINTIEKTIKFSENHGNINVFCQSKKLVEKLYNIFLNINHSKIVMEPNVNILLHNIEKIENLYEIEFAIILNFYSIELVLLEMSRVKYYKYYKIQSNLTDTEKEKLYEDLYSRSIYDYLNFIDRNDLIMEYLQSVNDVFKEIKGIIGNKTKNSRNLLLLGEMLDVPDYVEYIESIIGTETFELGSLNALKKRGTSNYKYLHIIKMGE